MNTLILIAVLSTQLASCDPSLWNHVYNPQRLQIIAPCTTVTGTIVDATHGKRKQGCRPEADGDLHCWLKLDPGQEQYLNTENLKNQGGNLVFEPMCQHRVTQTDAKAACKDWKQPLAIPPVGSHVSMTCSLVLDTQHGHNECHPVSSITILQGGLARKSVSGLTLIPITRSLRKSLRLTRNGK